MLSACHGLDRGARIEIRQPVSGEELRLVGPLATGLLLRCQPYLWRLTLVNNNVVNAASTVGRKIYVYGGMLPLLGQNKALWAAVLSHSWAP